MKKLFPVLSITIVVVIFFWRVFVNGMLPVPSDTIIGLYHPFRDLYVEQYPNGIPFKNFLISDPVRQHYPWREFAVSSIKKLNLPLWNPYNFSGSPLLANFQSAVFYPFNLVFFILPFNIGWTIMIMLQPLLAGVFLYWYLRSLSIHPLASFLGGVVFAFCGFSVAWMEWGTILHVGLWLPLILLSIDKIVLSIKNKKIIVWSLVFVFSLVSSFFAGHLQIFFYFFLLSLTYWIVRWFQFGRSKKILFLFLILNSLFIILTSIQWVLTLQFILHSARDIDQADWTKAGWFIPWQHLIQFVVPDFFGNPATLNYWGVWNYGELVGYVGIVPLIMSIFALFIRHDKKTFFFGSIFFMSLIFSLPTFFAKLPYILNIPFLSIIQPTRLLFIVDFSLAILASFGLDYFIKSKNRRIIFPLAFILFTLLGLWGFVFFGNEITKTVNMEDILVSKRNLVFPTLIFTVFAFFTLASIMFSKLHKSFTLMISIIIVVVTVVDLMRFGFKFTPFTDRSYLFPDTKTISFLQKNLGNHRMMTTDSRILPPNFSLYYRFQSVDGYDPLYLTRYAELIAASERGKPDISPPYGFNRIITPHNFSSKIIDLLGVKYVLSLTDLDSHKLKKVFQEGQTRVYENLNVQPRTFFVERLENVYNSNRHKVIKILFQENFNPKELAIVELDYSEGELKAEYSFKTKSTANIIDYSDNKVVIATKSDEGGFLVLSDSYYPTWKARIYSGDMKSVLDVQIYRTNYNFRGIFVPEGKHRVEFYNTLL